MNLVKKYFHLRK